MDIRRFFTPKEVLALTGITYSQLDYWVKKGLIRCSGKATLGKGSPRQFKFEDLVEIRTVKVLTDSGMKLGKLLGCVKHLRKTMRSDETKLSSVRIVTDGKHVFRYLSEEEKLETLDEFGQFAFAFGLDEEVRLLRDKIENKSFPKRYELRTEGCSDVKAG
jgi:DNA-binding transcriptional MerR regulator